jgi:hypothetical protein
VRVAGAACFETVIGVVEALVAKIANIVGKDVEKYILNKDLLVGVFL